ncbi:MAG: hypothetical protein HYY78_16440 [Betaproteobacteria bacterium]|nr:hypothetical protein [Betaproteobacteria bacterium]
MDRVVTDSAIGPTQPAGRFATSSRVPNMVRFEKDLNGGRTLKSMITVRFL